MAERRTLNEAIDMTPEKLAFIQGKAAPAAKPPPVVLEPQAPAEEKTVELSRPGADAEATDEPRPKIARRGSRARAVREAPQVGEILDQLLVPVTIRLQHRTAQALRRAYLEQRLKHAKPDTQQEIAEQALVEWLESNDYL